MTSPATALTLPPAPDDIPYLPGWEAAIAALLTDLESALAAAAREMGAECQADIEAAREIVTEARQARDCLVAARGGQAGGRDSPRAVRAGGTGAAVAQGGA